MKVLDNKYLDGTEKMDVFTAVNQKLFKKDKHFERFYEGLLKQKMMERQLFLRYSFLDIDELKKRRKQQFRLIM